MYIYFVDKVTAKFRIPHLKNVCDVFIFWLKAIKMLTV